MPKTRADGFTRKRNPQPTPKPQTQKPKADVKSEPPESKRQENIEALTRLKAERLAPKQNPKKANTAEKPLGLKHKAGLDKNTLKEVDYSVADKYLRKQIWNQTAMVFMGYDQTYPCTVAKFWKYNLNLRLGSRQMTVRKLHLVAYYKQEDAQKVESAMRIDSAIVAQSHRPIERPNERYSVDDAVLKTSQQEKTPIEMKLRTGHVFVGHVRWFTPYDIGLRLANSVKVHVFRHAIYAVEADGQLQGEG